VRGTLVSLVAELPMDPVVRASLIAGTARELRRIVADGGGTIEVRLEDVDMRPGAASAHVDGDHASPNEPDHASPEQGDHASPDDDLVLDPLLDVVREQHHALSWHQAELAETNAGLLALHAELEAQRGQLAFLDELNQATGASLDRDRIIERLSDLLGRRGVASTVVAWVLGDDGLLRLAAGGGQGRDRPTGAVRNALRNREVVGEGTLRLYVPLIIGRLRLGVLELVRDQDPFSAEDAELARHVAARVAVTLRNAWEYEQERDLAETLQQAMLPRLPHRDGVQLAAEYRAASRGANVGGDWYDAFLRCENRLIMAVGDVTGHGIEAAVLMGQLQNALRAYAVEEHGPATTLALVDRMLRTQPGGLFATAVVAELDIPSGRLRWAGAGHLPPAIRDADGSVRFLEQQQAPMLGLPLDVAPTEHETELPPDATLLLFTDGLIERRDTDIDTGLARLADSFGRLAAAPASTTGSRLVDALLGDERHEDDVCVLVCRHAGTVATAPAT
jgi:serine phosphatase RsbU (regulator of sigma subunit)